MEWYSAFIHHWDKVLVILIAVAAIWFLVRKFRKGECNCGSCGKKCPARKFGNEKK
ncbi:FeoB-associated Cys-rich membrane protein [uncultured Victivallis sp.]|uniref:FeoB-associated Cys-rich membrane protein n=1 Tax=uncultured Victivallis sp. TaxID=354118 RepID=UPI0025E23867|nr:FeoB-associated Cys-rich membrane protein [uncultured Victivallis sp.]